MEEMSSTPKQVPIEFTGSGMEYFKVWIVNIALTIVTLGIYSAWAKVRTNQYFYGNTRVLRQSFQYLATGGQILKGRIIAVVAFLAYQLLVNLHWTFAIALSLGFLVVAPWLINSGLRFNARMSSWRNVRFNFNGSYGGALMACFVWPLIGVLTLGILMPKAIQRGAKYIVESHSFGDESFDFTASVAAYNQVVWGLMIAYIALILTIIIGTSFELHIFSLIAIITIYVISFWIKPLLFNLYWQHVKLKGNGFTANMNAGRFAWIFISNSFAVVFSLGLLYPWSQVRLANFTAESLEVIDTGNIQTISAQQQEKTNALGEELGEVFDVDVGFGV